MLARNMKCPYCGAEVWERDKFCGECGKRLRHKIEIAPVWKWGSMIASLVLLFIFSLFSSYFFYPAYVDASLYWLLLILLMFGFPATMYLMYKERTENLCLQNKIVGTEKC